MNPPPLAAEACPEDLDVIMALFPLVFSVPPHAANQFPFTATDETQEAFDPLLLLLLLLFMKLLLLLLLLAVYDAIVVLVVVLE